MELLVPYKMSNQMHIAKVFDQAFDEFYIISGEDNRISYANQAALDNLQYSHKELSTLTVRNIVTGFSSKVLLNIISSIRSGGVETLVLEGQHLRKDGTAYPVESRLQYIESDESLLQFFVISRDITERKRAEQSLIDSRNFYLSLLDNFPLMIWASDVNAKCHYFNKKWLNFTGRSIEEEQDDGWIDNIHADDLGKCINTYLTAFEKRQAYEITYRLKRYDGEYRTVVDYGQPFNNIEGDFEGYIGGVQDITKTLQDQKNLRLYQKKSEHIGRVNMLGEMVAGIAHELNQPLTSVNNYCEIASEIVSSQPLGTRQSKEELGDILKKAVNQAHNASEIIRHIRRLISREAPVARHDINKVIMNAITYIKPEMSDSNISIDLQLAESLPDTFIDDVQIQHVLLNLMRNSIDAFSLKESDTKAVIKVVSSLFEENYVQVTVTDNGSGIDNVAEAKLFEHFYTTKKHGMGLGLAMSRSIIQQHGGRLWLIFDNAAETSFSFTIPVAA